VEFLEKCYNDKNWQTKINLPKLINSIQTQKFWIMKFKKIFLMKFFCFYLDNSVFFLLIKKIFALKTLNICYFLSKYWH